MEHCACPDCGEYYRFFSDFKTGIGLQSCKCRTEPITPAKFRPVQIPPEMKMEDAKYQWREGCPRRVPAVCKVCGKDFLTLAGHPGNLCAMRCRKKDERMRRHQQAVA